MRDFKDFLDSKGENVQELFGGMFKSKKEQQPLSDEEILAKRIISQELTNLINRYQSAASKERNVRQQRIYNTVAYLLKNANQ